MSQETNMSHKECICKTILKYVPANVYCEYKKCFKNLSCLSCKNITNTDDIILLNNWALPLIPTVPLVKILPFAAAPKIKDLLPLPPTNFTESPVKKWSFGESHESWYVDETFTLPKVHTIKKIESNNEFSLFDDQTRRKYNKYVVGDMYRNSSDKAALEGINSGSSIMKLFELDYPYFKYDHLDSYAGNVRIYIESRSAITITYTTLSCEENGARYNVKVI
jgi:hypothetical protein